MSARVRSWYPPRSALFPLPKIRTIGYIALQHRSAKFVVVLTEGLSSRDRASEATVEVLDHLALLCRMVTRSPTGRSISLSVGIDHAGVVLENGHPSLQLRDPDGVAIELVAP